MSSTHNRKYKTEKVAPSKDDAMLAATRDMLIKVHHNGVLREHFFDLQPPKVDRELTTQDKMENSSPGHVLEPVRIIPLIDRPEI